MRKLLLVVGFWICLGTCLGQGLVILSPQQNRKTLEAAYGKLPTDIVVWSVIVRGPVPSSTVSEILVAKGFAVIKGSIVQGFAARQKRLSWLTIAPQALAYTGLVLGSVADTNTGGVAWPLFGFAASKLIEFIPAQAASEKVGRLHADLCPADTDVHKDRVLECVVFTERVGVALLLPVEPFRVIIQGPEEEDPEVSLDLLSGMNKR